MKKILRLLVGLVLVIILIVIGALAYALGTESGLHSLVALAQKTAPGELQVQHASGQLLGSLDLQQLTYEQNNGLKLQLKAASLQWSPKALLSRQIHIAKLHTQELDIHLPKPTQEEDEKPSEPLTLPDVHLPVAIDIDDINLQNIRIYPYQAEKPIEIEHMQLTASMHDDGLHIIRFNIKTPEAQAGVRGTLHPQGDYPLNLKLSWQYKHAEFGDFSGDGTAIGDLIHLKLVHHVKGLAQLELESELFDLIEQPAWDAQIDIAVDEPSKLSPQLEHPIKAHLISQGNLDNFSATGLAESELAQTGPLTLNVDAQGNTKQLQGVKLLLKLRDQPTQVLLHGNADLQALSLNVQGQWKALTWPLIGDNSEFSSSHGNISVKGSAKKFTAQIKAKLDGQQLQPLDFELQANGNEESIRLSKLTLRSNKSDLRLKAQGQFNLAKQRFQASGDWQSLAWPMKGDAQFTSTTGTFEAMGLVKDYHFKLSTDVQGSSLPKGHWTFAGDGSDQALSQFKLDGKTLDGTLRASGKARWQPEVSWQVDLNGDHLNPGVHWPDLPGKLTTHLTSKGKLTTDGPQLNADIARLTGQFRGQKLHGKGHIELHGKALDIQALRLRHGRTQLTADGHLNNHWDLNWQLDAPDLSQLAPELTGRIQSTGKLTGSATEPRASLNLDIRDLAAGATKVKRLKGSAQIDISGAKTSALDVKGSNLVLGGQQWNKFVLSGAGKPNKHTLNITLNGEPGNMQAALKGKLKNEQWIGQLNQLAAQNTLIGDWALKQPAAIRASKKQADIDAICLSSQPTLLCLMGQWSATNGSKGQLTLTELNAKRFQSFLPEGMKLDTALSGKAQGSVDAYGVATAQADFAITPGRLTVDNNGEPLNIELNTGKLNANLDNNNALANILIDLGNLGKVNAETRVNGVQDSQQLSGKLIARLNDLSLISSFVPQLQAVEGNFHTDLSLGGTLKAPTVTGELQLTHFAAEIPEVAIHIKNTQLTARSDQNDGVLKIRGSSQSGRGKLTLSGQLDPTTQALQLNVKGQKFQVANSNTIRAVVSPDLKIGMNKKGMQIEGKVTIPQAYINAEGAGGEGGTVGVSSDVVLIDENGEPEKKEDKSGNLNLNVRVILGDDITVDAGDFNGELKGNLLIEQTPPLPPSGTGTIEVENGDFLVYGQQLKMERGRILFSGGPIDNPRLDMDVARRVEAYNVLAGAKIRGTAQAPQMQLYSEPSMPDASILSYILIGQPPGAKAGSYTLGKYITPDLYVSYGIALFNAISSFNMRYKLTETLSLKAASGAANSADLIYTIER
jgi:translocation and assembly module TamB